jgi:FkbM family methyltransferase
MVKGLIKSALHRSGFHILRTNSLSELADNLLGRRSYISAAYGFKPHETDFYNYYIRHRETISLDNSYSQLGQDLWIAYLMATYDARETTEPDRFFVEFGGFDGKTFSNTYFLEKERMWKGILAEPIPHQFESCKRNRDCEVDNRCVWKSSGEILTFNVVEGANELGTITTFESNDVHGPLRTAKKSEIKVKTVSLVDLLREHEAPPIVDYISVDTEGSELEILAAFPFGAFGLKSLSVEHNFTPQRVEIQSLLERNGFFRLARSLDYFDDIYLHSDWFPRLELGR